MKQAPLEDVIYISSTKNSPELIADILREKGIQSDVITLDDDLRNQFRHYLVKKLSNWKEKKSIEEYAMIPDNLDKIRGIFQLSIRSMGYRTFTLKEYINTLGCKYTEGENMLEMLFAISMCAFDDSGITRHYTLLPDKIAKLGYISQLRDRKAQELIDIDQLILLMESEISEAEQVPVEESAQGFTIEPQNGGNIELL